MLTCLLAVVLDWSRQRAISFENREVGERIGHTCSAQAIQSSVFSTQLQLHIVVPRPTTRHPILFLCNIDPKLVRNLLCAAVAATPQVLDKRSYSTCLRCSVQKFGPVV